MHEPPSACAETRRISWQGKTQRGSRGQRVTARRPRSFPSLSFGTVISLTEAVMGMTAALSSIASALSEVAEAIRDRDDS
jgi:hypothetical protein